MMQRKWKVLAVVSTAVFMSSLDLFIVNIAFPDIQRDFAGSSLASLSWILNGYAIVFAALLVPFGRSADRLRRKRSFIAGLSLFPLASALSALAPSFELLVAARVLQAVGAAAVFPTSLALVLPEFPPSERRTAVAVWAAVGGVAAAARSPGGGLVGPGVGGRGRRGGARRSPRGWAAGPGRLAARVRRERADRDRAARRREPRAARDPRGRRRAAARPRRSAAAHGHNRHAHARHREGARLGLGQRLDRRPAGRGGRPRGGVRRALGASPDARGRAAAPPAATVRARQRGRPAVLHGVRRHAAGVR